MKAAALVWLPPLLGGAASDALAQARSFALERASGLDLRNVLAESSGLAVTDVKQAPARGLVATWIGEGTEAFFRNLTITPAR